MLLLQSFASKQLIYALTLELGKCQRQQSSSFYKEYSGLENALVQKEILRNQDDSIH